MSPVLSLPLATLGVYCAETLPGQPPATPRLPLAFEPLLFLTSAHQALQQHNHPVLAFFLEDKAAGQTVAQLYVVPDFAASGRARSPGQASFGGVQLAPDLPVAALHLLLDAVEATLRRHGQRQLEVRGYPFCYDHSGAATLAEALRQRTYEVVLAEENYYLDTQRDYEAHLHRSERKRLRKCYRQGLVVEQEPPLLLPAAYAFIAACRQERGQPLSLPLARVEALFRAFPRQHFLFSVRRPSGEWVAMSLAIRVSARVLYNFYQASPLAANDVSPVVLLNEGLHDFAKANELSVVDLGISTLPGGVPHDSLLQFKRHLGCVASLKLTWHKAL
ncbi:GNAT family N-acetyltransferase [Hymenobacter sp. UV11]|uniref:GNAT family N-acetyltransferase n=1 Tax=Hymenobacter sp. UV11 TaxID=1849735 RepID=UPI0010E7B169|nr:GNAT family N-acetyltransferase [Hymenobacter sp. UV11]TDN38127.1 hypothetical protein A8B98_25330 [Hymenobacter sp. UV11]